MQPDPFRRRLLLKISAALFTAATARLSLAGTASAAPGPTEKKLSFSSLHTGEYLNTTYWIDGEYQRDALTEVYHILRDWRVDETRPIDTGLLDLLFALRQELDSTRPFEIISGYRSPVTNASLRKHGGGGVAKKSLHMQGMAVDIRLPGRDLRDLRKAAISLRRGGVGFYPRSGFVHVDTGRVRRWG